MKIIILNLKKVVFVSKKQKAKFIGSNLALNFLCQNNQKFFCLQGISKTAEHPFCESLRCNVTEC